MHPNRSLLALLIAPTAVLLMLGGAKAQPQTLPAQDLARVKAYFESNVVLQSRYMEHDCVPTTYPGWENLPTVKCTYSVKGSHDPAPKTAKVIMLNASPDQLSRWVVFACIEVLGNANEPCTSKLSTNIIDASGAQFPIAGIVFENLNSDGKFEIYPFRNGVTVKIDGVPYRGTHQPTNAQIEKSLNGDPTWTGQFARIQSTTREEYKANGGTEDVGDQHHRKLKWLEVSRDLYKAAWGQDRNELMIAWLRAN